MGRWMIELFEVTVCSPSCIMAISLLLSSEASARLLTELLWELAEMDILGTDWELSMLLTVPVLRRYCSTSWQTQTRHCNSYKIVLLPLFVHHTLIQPQLQCLPPRPPLPQIQGRSVGSPGRGSSSFFGTAGCPTPALHPWCVQSGP